MISGLDGINIHNIRYSNINKIKELKVSWARIDINWNEIESSKGSYNWDIVDESINTLNNFNINIYATISYVPSWINSNKYSLPDIENWFLFCKKVAERYRDKIKVYSLWNEPNLKTYSKFYDNPKRYVSNILKPGYTAIKTIGNYKVAAGDLSTSSNSKWTSWLDKLSDNQSYFDILSIHCYDHPIWKMRLKYNLGKVPVIGWLLPKWRPYKWYLNKFKCPIYLTECGYKADYDNKSENNNQLNYYKDLIHSKNKFKFNLIIGYHDHDYPLDEPWGLYSKTWNPKKVVEV